jgi:hypothetical protein
MGTIECAKCGCLNPQEGHRCTSCGHHLYVVCSCCGQRIPRNHLHAHRRILDSGVRGEMGRAEASDLVLGVGLLVVGVGILVFGASWPALQDWSKERSEQRAIEQARQMTPAELAERARDH